MFVRIHIYVLYIFYYVPSCCRFDDNVIDEKIPVVTDKGNKFF